MNLFKRSANVFLTLGCLCLVLAGCTSNSSSQTSNSAGGGPGAGASASGPSLDRIKATGTVRACVDPEFPPELFLTNGQPTGLDVDLLQAMAKALSAKLELTQTTFDGLIAGIQAGKCDVALSMVARAKRQLAVTFPKPWLQEVVGVVLRANDTRSTIAQLNLPSVKFCDQEGGGAQIAQEAYLPKVAVTNLNGADQCFLDVLSGKADATIIDDLTAYGFIQVHPQLKFILPDIGAFAAAPDGPAVPLGDYGFKLWIDAWFFEFVNNGNYTPLYQKYYHRLPDLQQLFIQRGGL